MRSRRSVTLAADRHALAQLEVRDRLLRDLVIDRLLAGDRRQVGHGGVDASCGR